MYKKRHVTVIVPALNEAPSIANVINGLTELSICEQCENIIQPDVKNSIGQADKPCLDTIKVSRNDRVKNLFCSPECCGNPVPVVDQIIVGDNGSTDETAAIAQNCGALVIEEPERGYGAACLAALNAPVDKDLIVFVDGDLSVAAHELPSLLEPLLSEAHLVIGSRTLGNCEKGALSIPQQMGNKLAIALMRFLWQGEITDLGPFRAISQSALTSLKMSDRKFGWTVEMQIRAFQEKLTIVEVPVSTHRRVGKSKISGTVRGVIGAAHGILGTIGKLYWRQIVGANNAKHNIKTYAPVSNLEDKPKTLQ